jgi:hypothetical protein
MRLSELVRPLVVGVLVGTLTTTVQLIAPFA